MLLGEGIQRVQSLYSRGLQSQDTRLTARHIYSALITGRAVLLSQQYNKNQLVNEWSYQTLPCVELIKAPVHECPCVPSAGCMILRSKHKIPKPISGIDKHLFKPITSLDGTLRVDDDTFENVKYASGNKYTSNKPSAFFRNQYLYIVARRSLKVVPLTGLFEDIVAAKQFQSYCEDCNDCNCDDIMDMEFPIDGDLVKPLIDIAAQELIGIMKQVKEDKNANATDDTGTQGLIHQPQGE